MQIKYGTILDTAPQEVLAWLLTTTTTRSRPRGILANAYSRSLPGTFMCFYQKVPQAGRWPSTLFFFI